MTITAVLQQQHRDCDSLLASAEAAARRRDWAACASVTQSFISDTEAHFRLEEESLFPAFEAATGMSGGPTQVMRMEHAEARSLMAGLGEALAARDADDFAGCCETLLILLQQHNLKEENILYPMCDRTVPDCLQELP
ncbi:hemerythrin domain-containing protein [Chitinilyticum piscinae]|uniref:Hemerythrin domain-containing protein n=1 Tax=Chitinilyticum piscinae TaxID=2866724 RepID=A0A8J7FN15_9NEIS|nr:hemerythrin domain-containing protein [Chitinilyticum piscinae]MBE9610500.1 hemerythrin domain-containing protein [Chitinilyticum piscinae]